MGWGYTDATIHGPMDAWKCSHTPIHSLTHACMFIHWIKISFEHLLLIHSFIHSFIDPYNGWKLHTIYHPIKSTVQPAPHSKNLAPSTRHSHPQVSLLSLTVSHSLPQSLTVPHSLSWSLMVTHGVYGFSWS